MNRFWAGQAIRMESFVAICGAVGVDWQAVADPDAMVEASAAFTAVPSIFPLGQAACPECGQMLPMSATRVVVDRFPRIRCGNGIRVDSLCKIPLSIDRTQHNLQRHGRYAQPSMYSLAWGMY